MGYVSPVSRTHCDFLYIQRALLLLPLIEAKVHFSGDSFLLEIQTTPVLHVYGEISRPLLSQTIHPLLLYLHCLTVELGGNTFRVFRYGEELDELMIGAALPEWQLSLRKKGEAAFTKA